jgi:predicted phage-related endonuclease
VYLVKKGLATVEENLPMKVGKWLEDHVADEFERIAREECLALGPLEKTGLHRHSKWPFLGCNPDRMTTCEGAKCVVQIKTCSEYSSGDFGKNGSDDVKDEHMMQVVYEMGITRSPVGFLVVMIGNREIKWFKLTWTDPVHAIWKRAVEEAVFFWTEYFLVDQPPPLSGKDIDYESVKAAYQTHGNDMLRAGAEAEEVLDGYDELCAQFKKLEEELGRRKNVLREIIGGNEGIITDSKIVTWKADKNGQRTLRLKERVA